MLLLLKGSAPSGAGGSIGAPASLPHLSLVQFKAYTLTAEQGSYSLSGQDATWLVGYNLTADQGTYDLTGQDASLLYGDILPADQGTYTLTGQDVTFTLGYVLSANQGAYDLIGTAADLLYSGEDAIDSPAPLPSLGLLGGLGYVPAELTAEQGSYALTGQDVTFLVTYTLPAEQGSYSLSGQIVGLDASSARAGDPAPLPHIGLLLQPGSGGYTLTCDTGVYELVGSEALLDFEIASEQGSYALTGQDAGLLVGYLLTAEQGSYALTGQDSSYSITGTDVTMAADYGTYDLSGQAAGLYRDYPMPAEQGFYGLLGQAATFSLGTAAVYSLTAESGTYALTGQDAALSDDQYILPAETGYYSLQGFDVVGVGGGVVPAGRSKRRRKTEVEIDGQVFNVNSKEEAAELLRQARELAEKTAKEAIERASKAQKRPTRKVLADARKSLKTPEIDADEELKPEVDAFKEEVARLYAEAMQAVEIAALMRKAEDEDEEEALLLLLA